jgi:serine/threonine-protein kinase
MDKSRWQTLSPLLDDLLDSESAVREIKLRELAVRDPELAAELKSLLADHAAVDEAGFLANAVLNPVTEAGLEGQVIDRYTLDRLIGEGGMGSVWLAHRSDGRYEGQVAIKFLSLPSIGPAGRQRFEREGHVLARLTHQNIARLLDAGVTASGQPYLVLEYVPGEPIDAWCKTHTLSVAARLELFLQVLSAVTHAHGKLILHRDLKPSNILVNAEGQVKLLDFGIAKLLEDERAGAMPTEMTYLAGRAFTLDYASPEQVQGGEVTTATDVYSLGVLLYVILTDQHPTAGNSTTPAERIRAVVDTEPRRASAALASTKDRADGDRHLERVRALRGDLDNVVAKALKKAPGERYPTADAFAQDLHRYLNDEPVSARADSFVYRARKFVVRNALPVAAVTIVMLAILGAAIVSIWQAREATRQRDRALALSARNAAVVDFVTSMLLEVAPDDQPIRMSELLARSEQILVASEIAPEHQAATLDVLAEYYLSAGDAAKAQSLLDRSLELSARSNDPALRGSAICNRGHALSLLNDREGALKAIEEGIALSRVDVLANVRCLQKGAFVAHNFNDPETALRYTREAQDALRRAPVRRPDQEASLIADLAYAHYLSGHTADADRYYADALDRYAKLGRAESPVTFSLRNNWGIASFAAGDNRRALENYDEALRIARHRSPDTDPPLYLLSNRALALASLARFPEALEAFENTIAAAGRMKNLSSLLHAQVNRAGTYLIMGDVDRAASELATLEANYGATLPRDSVPAITIQYLNGRIATQRGDTARALALLSGSIDFFDERGMQVAPLTRALTARATAKLKTGDVPGATADTQRAIEISKKLQGEKPYSSLTGQSLLQLAEIESVSDDRVKSQATAKQALAHLAHTLGTEHPDALRAKVLASF